jgi:hypothetical protein
VKGPFRRRTWYSLDVIDAEGDHVCIAAGQAELDAILEALNREREVTKYVPVISNQPREGT